MYIVTAFIYSDIFFRTKVSVLLGVKIKAFTDLLETAYWKGLHDYWDTVYLEKEIHLPKNSGYWHLVDSLLVNLLYKLRHF